MESFIAQRFAAVAAATGAFVDASLPHSRPTSAVPTRFRHFFSHFPSTTTTFRAKEPFAWRLTRNSWKQMWSGGRLIGASVSASRRTSDFSGLFS